jgi:hypothetical protein
MYLLQRFIFVIFLLFQSDLQAQQNLLFVQADSLSLLQPVDTNNQTTQIPSQPASSFDLYDTISNRAMLFSVFYPFMKEIAPSSLVLSRRDNLPGVKEIRIRKEENQSWRFWLICFVLIYIAFVRISNPNNFWVFLLSVFNIKLSEKIWGEQRYTFTFTTLQLFLIYLLVASLFITEYAQFKFLLPVGDPLYKFILVFTGLAILYTIKFVVHAIIGLLFKARKLAVSSISNTVSVNNFIALVILPFIIFFSYNSNELYLKVLAQVVIALFMISVLYRIARMSMLSRHIIGLPKIYLFVYLCALEILPWFVILKYLNGLQL